MAWVCGHCGESRDHLVGDHEQHGTGGQSEADGIGDGQPAGEADAEQGPERLKQTAADGNQHGFAGAKPAAHMASATASPSGMSCNAMAVVSGRPTDMSPCEKLTPMAIPPAGCAGRWQTRTARPGATLVAGTTGAGLVMLMGVNWSSPSISSTPRVMPATTTAAARKPLPVSPSAASSPGSSREKRWPPASCRRQSPACCPPPAGDRAQKEGWQGAERGGGKAGQAAEQAVANAGADVAGGQHHQALQQQQHDGASATSRPMAITGRARSCSRSWADQEERGRADALSMKITSLA